VVPSGFPRSVDEAAALARVLGVRVQEFFTDVAEVEEARMALERAVVELAERQHSIATLEASLDQLQHKVVEATVAYEEARAREEREGHGRAAHA
jgi:multidrug resistance efflux pump